MTSYRRHGRTLLKCAVKLEHDQLGEVVAEVRDVSETGIFVTCKPLINKISIGDAIKAELFSDEDGLTYSQLTVVRLTEDGVGFAYE